MTVKIYNQALNEQHLKYWFDLKKKCDEIMRIEPNIPLKDSDLNTLLQGALDMAYILQYPFPEYGELLIQATVAVANTNSNPEIILPTRELFGKVCKDIQSLIQNSGAGGLQ